MYFTNLEAAACRQSSAGCSSSNSGSAPEVVGDQMGTSLPRRAHRPNTWQVAEVPLEWQQDQPRVGLAGTACPRGTPCPGSHKPAGQRPSDEVSAVI